MEEMDVYQSLNAIHESIHHIIKEYRFDPHRLSFQSFHQKWPGNFGFGGASPASTVDSTVVVIQPHQGESRYVYIQGRFAYVVEHPSEQFFDDVDSKSIIGPDKLNDLSTNPYERDV